MHCQCKEVGYTPDAQDSCAGPAQLMQSWILAREEHIMHQCSTILRMYCYGAVMAAGPHSAAKHMHAMLEDSVSRRLTGAPSSMGMSLQETCRLTKASTINLDTYKQECHAQNSVSDTCVDHPYTYHISTDAAEHLTPAPAALCADAHGTAGATAAAVTATAVFAAHWLTTLKFERL